VVCREGIDAALELVHQSQTDVTDRAKAGLSSRFSGLSQGRGGDGFLRLHYVRPGRSPRRMMNSSIFRVVIE